MDGNIKVVRRNFTFPEDFVEKFERLRKKLGATSNSEVLRIALNKLDEAHFAPVSESKPLDVDETNANLEHRRESA